jgi:hypothetical protein
MDRTGTGAPVRDRGSVVVWTVVVACVLLLSPAVRADTCPPGNLLQLDGVRASTTRGDAERVLSGRFAAEGSDPSDHALRLDTPLTIDFGALRTLRALMIQADHDDVYTIEGSLDGMTWFRLAVAGESGRGGLRSRAIRLSRTAVARQLRITASGGDGSFAVSEIAAWCRAPEQPPAVVAPAPAPRRRAIRIAQFVIACLGLAVFLTGPVLRRLGRGGTARRPRDGALAVLGVLAGLAWWNFGLFHASGFLHTWEHFHYFLGGKYFDELAYTRLYECVTVADLESGLEARVRTRQIRDMTTNRRIEAASIVSDPERCTRHFTDKRWEEFKGDVAWFRGKLHPAMWERVFLDHGYNAPPSWTMLGKALTQRLRATDGTLLALGLLDPILLAVMCGAIWWAFGWRTGCVALLWWGTNQMANFAWTGGGLLRQDWLLLSILGICLVRRRYPIAGGFALGYAALLRIFPGLIIAALVLRIAAESLRARRLVLTRHQKRFAVGCLAAFALLLPLSAATSGGLDSWRAFIDNTRANTRAAGGNTVGFMRILTYAHETRDEAFADPSLENAEESRREVRRSTFRQRRPVFWIAFTIFLVLLARAVRDEEDWAALALGMGLVPMGVFVASYYYAILLGYGLLWRRFGDVVGFLLCALSVATHVGVWIWPAPVQMDTRFAWNSAATVAVVMIFALLAIRYPAASGGSSRLPASGEAGTSQ